VRCHRRRVFILKLIEEGMNEFGVAMKLGIKFSSTLATFHRYRDAGLIRWDSEQQRWVLTELGKRYLEECRKRGVG
jgi:hypothetical protein